MGGSGEGLGRSLGTRSPYVCVRHGRHFENGTSSITRRHLLYIITEISEIYNLFLWF